MRDESDVYRCRSPVDVPVGVLLARERDDWGVLSFGVPMLLYDCSHQPLCHAPRAQVVALETRAIVKYRAG